ncbi:MAG: transketolase [Candidatus Zixiibacteriota bacterium]
MFDDWRGFKASSLSPEWESKLKEMARVARGHIVKMTSIAGSGHPGGSMSSVDLYLTLYHMARINPQDPDCDERDRIIVSHGHTSPGVYASLAAAGFFDIEPVLHGFRQAGSPFEGHVEKSVPGVEWDTGNLGQGLSVGVGKAIYARQAGLKFHSYVLMGDGEQQKGQIGEARRIAVKYKLYDLTAAVDYNRLQISGKIKEVMPQNIKAEWEADGWKVLEIDGHDFRQIYEAFYKATHDGSAPYMILAHTVMGKGVSFMENDEAYHGASVNSDMVPRALEELGVKNDIDRLLEKRKAGPPPPFVGPRYPDIEVIPGEPITYRVDEKMDNRGAWGKALMSVAEANLNRAGFYMAVFDNDLSGSVKTAAFGKKYPDRFYQCGISEHNTAVMAGALSTENILTIWAAFGVFGVDETYNQARLNDINHTNLKLFCTHSGVNVGEDGKTHHCIDYFGLLNSTFGWKVITPADPNQTDRIARYVLGTPGNFAVIMGRSKMLPVTDEKGQPFFGGDYKYRYGRMEIIRTGDNIVLVAAGNMLAVAVEAWNKLKVQDVTISVVAVSDWSDLHPDDLRMLGEYEHIVTLEDHNVKTGLGSAVATALYELGIKTGFTRLGITRFAPSGKPDDLYKMLGLDAGSVSEKIKTLLGEHHKIGC